MRTAIILGRKHGGKKLELVSGPDVPIVKQLETFKDHARAGDVNKDFEYLELWTSDGGRTKKRSFDSEATAKAKAEAQAKREAQAKEAAAKAKADEEAKAKAAADAEKKKAEAQVRNSDKKTAEILKKHGAKVPENQPKE
jgi:hypothetical protein